MPKSRNRKGHRVRSISYGKQKLAKLAKEYRKQNEEQRRIRNEARAQQKAEAINMAFQSYNAGSLPLKSNQVDVFMTDMNHEMYAKADFTKIEFKSELMPIRDERDNIHGVAQVQKKGQRIIANLHLYGTPLKQEEAEKCNVMPVLIGNGKTGDDFNFIMTEVVITANPHPDKRIKPIGEQKKKLWK